MISWTTFHYYYIFRWTKNRIFFTSCFLKANIISWLLLSFYKKKVLLFCTFFLVICIPSTALSIFTVWQLDLVNLIVVTTATKQLSRICYSYKECLFENNQKYILLLFWCVTMATSTTTSFLYWMVLLFPVILRILRWLICKSAFFCYYCYYYPAQSRDQII